MQIKARSLKILLIKFSLIITGSLNLNAENLIESGKWIYFADNVMGGISEGKSEYVTVPSVSYTHLTLPTKRIV